MAIGLFDRLEEFEQGLTKEEIRGTVTVVAEDGEQLYLLPRVVERYRRLFPYVELRLLTRPISQTTELVRQNEVDLGIVPKGDFPEGLVFHPWRTFEAYLVAPRGHPLVRSAKADFRSLLNRGTILRYPLIVGESQELLRHRLSEGLVSLGLPLNVAFVVGSMETLKRYVLLGLGVAVVSGVCLTEQDHDKMEIVQVPPEYGGQTTYGVLIRERKHVDPALKGLLSLLDISAV
jgi:DNA-binding transcriptional LysR family regulator